MDSHSLLGQSQAGGMTYPVVFGTVGCIIAVVAFVVFRKPLDAWLHVSRIRRVVLCSLAFLFDIGVILFADLVDFSRIAEGHAQAEDRFFLIWFLFCCLVFGWISILIFYHTDSWDDRLKQVKEKAKLVRAVERDFGQVVAAGSSLVYALERKAMRLERMVADPQMAERDGRAFASFLGQLDPAQQVKHLMEALHTTVSRSAYRSKEPDGITVRVALYDACDGFMVPVESYDGERFDCITSPLREHREKFRISSFSPDNFVMSCSESDAITVIADTERADSDSKHPFRYYSDNQRHRIKSMAGFKVEEGVGNSERSRVVTIDCNRPNHFDESRDEEILKYFRKVFSARFRFEHLLSTLQAKNNAPEGAVSPSG